MEISRLPNQGENLHPHCQRVSPSSAGTPSNDLHTDESLRYLTWCFALIKFCRYSFFASDRLAELENQLSFITLFDLDPTGWAETFICQDVWFTWTKYAGFAQVSKKLMNYFTFHSFSSKTSCCDKYLFKSNIWSMDSIMPRICMKNWAKFEVAVLKHANKLWRLMEMADWYKIFNFGCALRAHFHLMIFTFSILFIAFHSDMVMLRVSRCPIFPFLTISPDDEIIQMNHRCCVRTIEAEMKNAKYQRKGKNERKEQKNQRIMLKFPSESVGQSTKRKSKKNKRQREGEREMRKRSVRRNERKTSIWKSYIPAKRHYYVGWHFERKRWKERERGIERQHIWIIQSVAEVAWR